MTKKSNTKKSPVALAEEHVLNVEESITSLAAEIEPLQKEREQLQQKALLSPAEVDRLADLESGSLPRREGYLQRLRTEVLPDAVASLRREELLALTADGADGIQARHDEMKRRLSEAEQTATQALADARHAVEEWNRFVSPLLAVAEEAGQDDRNPVDPEHPVTVTIDSMYPRKPLYITVNGENYRPRNADATVRKIAGKADPHVARVLHLGADEMTNLDVRRGRFA